MFKDEPLLSAALLLTLITMTGCASGPAKLDFAGESSNAQYSQSFTRAFYSMTDEAEYDVVLSEDGIKAAKASATGPIATSAATAPLKQTVHIRIRWRPLRGSKPDAPTATNAVIDWYVRSNDPSETDFLHYQGAGFVGIYGSDPQSRFVIRSSHLELTGHRGRLTDPLGPCSVTGSIIATRSDSQVTSILSQLREQFAVRTTPRPLPLDGPPPRVPSTP